MTRDDRDRIEHLDRQWDRYVNDSGSASQDEELARIDRLHRRDDAQAPSAEFRSRLEADLRGMHPAGAAERPGAGTIDENHLDDEAELRLAGGDPRHPVSFNRPGTLRQWGELAAMLVILILAIAGAALFGDDAYDYAQRQLSEGGGESDTSSEALGDGMTFEEARERAPFDLVMPSYVPEGLSLAWADASFPSQFTSGVGEWETAHAELAFETGYADFPEVGVRFTPSSLHSAAPIWLVEDVLDVHGTGVIRAARPDDVHYQYIWRQGDVYVSVSALNDPEAMSGENHPDELPYTLAEIERMIESIVEQGPLESNDDEIQSQNFALDGISENMSTDPLVPDPIPEGLQLQLSNAWMDGLEMILGHESDERVGEIALMQSWVPGDEGRRRFEALWDTGGESIEVGDMSVTRHVLPDWTGREAVDYLLAVGGPRPRVLPSWLPRNVETGLVTYIWDIGDWRFTLGVEVSRDLIEVDEDSGARLVDDAPEADWLALAPATADAWNPDDQPSEEREALDDEIVALEEEGEVDGLSFEEAQALTPFEIAAPGELPDGVAGGEYAVSVASQDWLASDRRLNLWQAEASFEIPGESLDPVTLSMQPAGEQQSFPAQQEVRVEGQEAPAGNLGVIEIAGSGVIRSVELSDEGEVHTSYLWQQGDVALTVRAPFGVDLTDEQRAQIEAPDAPFGNDEIERTIASLMEKGSLAVDEGEIPQGGLTLDQAREWLPTAPFPDEAPDQIDPSGGETWINLHGPVMSFRHASDDMIGDISVRAFSGYYRPGRQEQIHEAGGESLDYNGIQAGRTVLTDPTAPETADYIVDAGLPPSLLLPWLEDDSGGALVTYVWDIAGMGFLMGVEVPPEYVEVDSEGNAVLTDSAPEGDWLALIDAQRRTAEEHLRPEQHFSVLEREPTGEDELPDDPDWEASRDEPDQTRLLTETEHFRYYMLVYDNREVCVRQINVEREQLEGGGCSPLWSAADTGVVFGSGGTDVPTVRATILSDGYHEVVDENGDQVGEVESNIFVIEVESGETRPRGLTARGPAGEVPLGPP